MKNFSSLALLSTLFLSGCEALDQVQYAGSPPVASVYDQPCAPKQDYSDWDFPPIQIQPHGCITGVGPIGQGPITLYY